MATLVFIVLFLIGVLVWVVMTQPPQKTAPLLVNSGPLALMGLGILLTAVGRGFIGLPLVFIGLGWLRRNRPIRPMSSSGGRKSTVRSAHLEMELDHDTGEMDGTVLTGNLQGARLSSLSESDIIDLCREFQADGDSLTLLESFLDRYHPDWRERAGGESSSTRREHTPADGQPMSRQEACQILGVAPDATPEEIHEAWRRLIKRVHPDTGGSAFLTAKINTAKDVLLG